MTTRFTDHFLGPDVHANIPAAAAVPVGSLYMCTTHGIIVKNDGAAWNPWLTLPTFTTDPEVVRDTIAAALVAGTNMTVTPDDAGDTITLASTGGGGGGSGGVELAYAEITSTFSTTSAADVAVPGLSITVTVGSRPVWIEAAFPYATVTGGAAGTATMSLYQGATQIGFTGSQVPSTGGATGGPRLRRRIPAGSGTLTFSVQVAGTTSMTKAFQAAANNPAYISANEV